MKRVNRVKGGLLVFTHIGVKRQGQPLHHREHCLEVAENAARFAANLFSNIRILLIRHDGRARAEIV